MDGKLKHKHEVMFGAIFSSLEHLSWLLEHNDLNL